MPSSRRAYPASPDHADGSLHGARFDPDRRDDILGPDGDCRDGGLAGCNRSDADLSTGTVCRLVPCQGACGNGKRGYAEPHCYGRSVSPALFLPTIVRAAGFFLIWCVLTGGGAADLLVGVVAA